MKDTIRKFFVPIILLLAVLSVYAVTTSGDTFFRSTWQGERTFEEIASEIFEECAKRNYPPSCYDEEIPKLMDQGLTMEEAFQVTALVQEKDQNYFYCHVLGHNLSAKEAAKDLSKWTEVIARAPSGICSNGAIHGAFQERFRDEILTGDELQAIIPQLDTICENSNAKTFTGLEQASCYHAIGHLSMYMTGANIHEATSVVCDQIAKKGDHDYTQTCYEGAYMQIFQPLEPEDFMLIKDIEPQNKEEAQAFCNEFSGERRAACHRESWPHYRDDLQESSVLQAFCNLVPDQRSVNRCYNAMFYVLTAQFGFDKDKIISLCEGLPKERQGQCFANSASRFVETDYRLAQRAVEVCDLAEERGVGDRCYSELLFYSTFNFHPGSEEFKNMCNVLPESWEKKCLTGEGLKTQPSVND